MLDPTASGLGRVLGHDTTAPTGTELTLHTGLGASAGPLLVQVTVPLTVLPTAAVLGKPEMTTCMSACGRMSTRADVRLLPVFPSAVLLPAVVVIVSGPLAGAVKLLVQLMLAPTASGFGAGLGVQVCVAPLGKPPSAHVGVAAGLGPSLVQVPDTVTV